MTEQRQTASKPRRRSRRPAHPARGEGREALYMALVRIVARDGFDGVTFRSVAAEAGVTHGLASYHFGTRETMIDEALSWAVRHSIEATHLAVRGSEVSEFVAGLPHALTETADEAVFQFDLLLRALRTPSLREQVRKSYDDYIAATAESLRSLHPGIDDEAVARLVFAALDGLTLQQLLYGDERRTHDALSSLREMLVLLASAGDETGNGAGNPER